MSTPLQPLADYVVTVAEEAQKKTSSGLYLPDNATEKPTTAKVVAVGEDVKRVKVGDRVVHKDSYQTTKVKVDKEEFIIVKEEDVLAIVK